jgi:hypothetical protein
MPKKPKKERLPFWKSEKLPPEVRSFFAHIGKAADNMTHTQWSELLLYGGLAMASIKAGYELRGKKLDLASIPTDALVGPIALKLATTMGGSPPVSQIAGLSTLVTLGLASSGWLYVPDLSSLKSAVDEKIKSLDYLNWPNLSELKKELAAHGW